MYFRRANVEDIMLGKKKRLKKIPSDLVSYIMIETEAIKDINDKMMISSYCLQKLNMIMINPGQDIM